MIDGLDLGVAGSNFFGPRTTLTVFPKLIRHSKEQK